MFKYFTMLLFYIFYIAFVYNTLNIGNLYSGYINNFTFLIEIYYWILFVISGLFLLIFVVYDEKIIISKTTREAIEKYKKQRNSLIYKCRLFVCKTVDIAFILFVGIVAGDFSLFFVMFFVELFTFLIINRAKGILEKKIKEEEESVV